MTLILKLDLDMVLMRNHTKNVFNSRCLTVTACTDRHTERQYENLTLPAFADGNYEIYYMEGNLLAKQKR